MGLENQNGFQGRDKERGVPTLCVSNRKLLVTSATLLVTSALLLVTRSYYKQEATSNKEPGEVINENIDTPVNVLQRARWRKEQMAQRDL